MPCLPAMKYTTIIHSPSSCDASSLIFKSLHGYNAYAFVVRIQVHHSGPLFPNLFAGVGYASKKNTVALGKWILHDIIYHWGLLLEIVTNNGPAFLKALTYLEKHYHIKHIRISGYNSCANGIVERSHFEVREAISKACDGDKSKWSGVAYSVFWAERVTIRCRMGCSPYFTVTGTHPLLPIDIVEANYLLPPQIQSYHQLTLLLSVHYLTEEV